MNILRYLAVYILAGLLLAGCSSLETTDNEEGDSEKVTFRFTVGGIEDQTEETLTRMGGQEQIQESFTKTDDGLMMVSTFSVDTTSQTRATTPMATGTKYRVAAYKSNGTLKGTADGVAGIAEAELPLAYGSYNVVAYSMNTDLLPTHSESLPLNSSDDFLWVHKGVVNVTANSYTDITLTFVHQRCAVKMQADASVIVHNQYYASLYGEGAKITNFDASYTFSSNSVTFVPATGIITEVSSTSVSPPWTGLNTMAMSSDEVYFYPTTSTSTVNAAFTEITFSWDLGEPSGLQAYTGINKTVSFTPTLTRGTKYTFKTKFHKLCGAKMAAYGTEGAWKQFMCFNLGATDQTDPFTPSSGISGNYYQWGRPAYVATAETPKEVISGWDVTYAPTNSWLDTSKTTEDPCPDSGYGLVADIGKRWRVPTADQFRNVTNTALNSQRKIGTDWTSSSTNFSTGWWLGNNLFLPTAGRRYSSNGELRDRGIAGYYWSTTLSTNYINFDMFLSSSSASVSSTYYRNGFSLRCISE